MKLLSQWKFPIYEFRKMETLFGRCGKMIIKSEWERNFISKFFRFIVDSIYFIYFRIRWNHFSDFQHNSFSSFIVSAHLSCGNFFFFFWWKWCEKWDNNNQNQMNVFPFLFFSFLFITPFAKCTILLWRTVNSIWLANISQWEVLITLNAWMSDKGWRKNKLVQITSEINFQEKVE